MKKLYKTVKFRKYNRKRAERSNRRRLRHKEKKRKSRILQQTENRTNKKYLYSKTYENKRKHTVEIVMPENCSIINNTEEMLSIFRTFRKYVPKQVQIFFDMSSVSELTGDAIIYMLSMFDWHRKKRGQLNIRGNFPKDQNCSNLLRSSGFFKYMNTPAPNIQHSKYILEIEKDTKVQPHLAKNIVAFTREHLQLPRNKKTKDIYKTIIECMANTKNHAFEARSISPLWYLMSIYDEKSKDVTFTFLDAGFGIPKTIRINKAESFLEKIDKLMRKLHKDIKLINDMELIMQALKGAFRTRTIKGYRGKGLPAIHQYYKSHSIENLIIISRRGYINLSQKNRVLRDDFLGTMVSWKINKESLGGLI